MAWILFDVCNWPTLALLMGVLVHRKLRQQGIYFRNADSQSSWNCKKTSSELRALISQ